MKMYQRKPKQQKVKKYADYIQYEVDQKRFDQSEADKIKRRKI